MMTSDLIKTIRRIDIRTRHLVNDSFAGEYKAIFKGRGMEFDEVRPYQPGDEVRSIDWNVTARMHEPFVKRYVEERELTVMLAVDASASGLFGTKQRFRRELAAELGAVLAFSAISNNDKVGLIVFTDQVELHIPPRKGHRHVLRLTRDLLAFEPQHKGTDITLALDHLNRTLKRRTIIFMLSDFLYAYDKPVIQTAYEKALVVTNRHHDLVSLVLTDDREMRWPDIGLIVLEDAESGQQLWLDSSDPSWQSYFSEHTQDIYRWRRAVLSRAQVDHITITVGEDYVKPLMVFFQGRARRWR
ncbi:MAG: DUF58 domain-containing protein [Anaerolineae bacterium]|nr:DUF58 domain-containing protein [Anaerolineae bacterium]